MKTKDKFLSIYIRPDLKAMLRLHARQEGRSMSAQAERIISSHLWKLQAKETKCRK